MQIVVRKYGGSSLSSVEKIARIAADTSAWLKKNTDRRLIMVVSAMGDTTDDLKKMSESLTNNPDARELDMLLTAGERISMALMAIALKAKGIDAVSFTGSQAGINSESRHNSARIVKVQADRVVGNLHRNKVVVLAGFQGVSPTKDVTTLGRGGSDTSAVAVACAIGAEYCEICTDVEGIFDSDPRITGTERLISETDFDSLLDMAVFGAKVIHPRAVELARKFDIELTIRNSFRDAEGTRIRKEVNVERSRIESVNFRDDILLFKGSTDNWSELLRKIRKSRMNVMNPQISYGNKTVDFCFWSFKEEWMEIDGLSPRDDLGIIAVTGFELSSDITILEEIEILLEKIAHVEYMFSTGRSYVFFMPDNKVEEAAKAIFDRYLKGI